MTQDIFEGGLKLPLMEQFYTVQGEGFHSGKPAYFIRIGGCDIGCSWCDSKFSWDAARHPLIDVRDLVIEAKKAGANSLVVTGGEPSLYNLSPLCDSFRQGDFELFLETSGAYPLTGHWDWICLSPKKRNPPKDEYFNQAGELKVIIQTQEDLIWAEENASKIKSADCQLYLQPEWSNRENIIPMLLEYAKKNSKWRISLQTHKYIGIP